MKFFSALHFSRQGTISAKTESRLKVPRKLAKIPAG
jgi:hypothetical protein